MSAPKLLSSSDPTTRYASLLRGILGTGDQAERTPEQRAQFAAYRGDPVCYAQDRLGVRWSPQIEAVARSVRDHQKTLVKASHSVGKTHGCAGITLWWHECFVPGIALTSAPTKRQVEDLLWREVRSQAPRDLVPRMLPKAPQIDGTSPKHYAVGYTAADANAFQGRHEDRLLVIFDEATGIDQPFWDAAEGMTTGPNNRWVAILNPTDVTSPAYFAEQDGSWNVITISALEHPNIALELAGLPPLFPNAVRLGWLLDKLQKWCTPLAATDGRKSTDLEFPPASGNWYRPGPKFESRVMGRWPTQTTDAVWSDSLLAVAFREPPHAPLPELDDVPCEIGCDVARAGDDDTTMHVRRGNVSLHHERHNGWRTDATAGRLKQLADEYGGRCGAPGTAIVVKIDDNGVGGGVVDQRGDYAFVGLSASRRARDPRHYPNRRSELWFDVAERAEQGDLDLSRLTPEDRREIRRQFMTPKWSLDNQGRRTVEPKDDTKKRLGASPDDADAINLAYAADRSGIALASADPSRHPEPPPDPRAGADKQRTIRDLLAASGY